MGTRRQAWRLHGEPRDQHSMFRRFAIEGWKTMNIIFGDFREKVNRKSHENTIFDICNVHFYKTISRIQGPGEDGSTGTGTVDDSRVDMGSDAE